LNIPNLPEESVPYGLDESENNVIKTVGNPKTHEFATKPHWELGADLGIIDFKSGVNLSGSRFYVLKGKGATLQRALIQWMLNYHITEHGYTEVYLPNLVKKNTAINSGQLPKFSDNMYRDEEDDLWLVPTAEVPLTSLHQDETIDAETLPIKYLAHTPCFRREKASAGRDTRGIKRVHQFEKVEMYKLCPPEQSDAELKSLVENAESICKALNFHYRIIELCTGDLGFAAQKTYDLEVWSPGSKEWLEVSSCSNCGDFQARRTNIKYRTDKKDKPKFLNTLNGSGLAIPRVLIAILEQNQQSDGTINIPEPLRKYTGFDQIP
jgi:seryl-tRNA synthetase